MFGNNQSRRYLSGDLSLWLLVFSNFATIFLAITQDWSLVSIMWVYWFQSVTIGLFNFIRILGLKEFSTDGLKFEGQQAKPTKETQLFSAFFFLCHYGFFHLVYLIFLLAGLSDGTFGEKIDLAENMEFVFFPSLLFFTNHLFSFIYNKQRDTKKQNIGTVMFYPYLRIIPMHLTIILGFSLGLSLGNIVLPFFLILKTFSDAIMHTIEHRLIRKGGGQSHGSLTPIIHPD